MPVLIVAAMIRRDDELLLIRQQGRDDPEAFWALPGGVVEPGELLIGALAREVWEETGLTVTDPGPVAYVTHSRNPTQHVLSRGELPAPGGEAIAFVFEVGGWDGELSPGDPDAYVSEARFFPPEEALDLLKRIPFRAMREPGVALLRGEARHGAVWLYHRGPDGLDRLVART